MRGWVLIAAALCTAQFGDALAAPVGFLQDPFEFRPLPELELTPWGTPNRELLIARRPRSRRYSQVAATGAVAWTNAKSVWLDGIDEIVGRADEAALSCDVANEMTFCAWYHVNETGAIEALGAKWDYQTQGEWASQVDTANFTGYFYLADALNGGAGNNVKTGNGDFPAFTWVLFCVWYDGSGGSNADRARIYIDAVNESSVYTGTIPSAMLNGSASFKIGQWGGTIDRPFPGRIDEPCMWCEALSEADITTLYNSGTAIDCRTVGGTRAVVLRHGDGDTHPTAINSGSAGDFTYVNTEATDLVRDVPGQNTHAFSPDGIDERLVCSDLAEWDGASKFTVSQWIYSNGAPTNLFVSGKWSQTAADRTWSSFIDVSGYPKIFLKNGASGNSFARFDTALVATTWYHICWQYNGDEAVANDRLALWQDGDSKALSHSGTHEATLQASTAEFTIAADSEDASNFQGRIDEVAVWVGTLEDCATIYNNGVPQKLAAYTTVPTHIYQVDSDTFPTATDGGSNPDSCTYTNMESGDKEEFTP